MKKEYVWYGCVVLILVVSILHFNTLSSDFTMGDFIENPESYTNQKKSFMATYDSATQEGFRVKYNHHFIDIKYEGNYQQPRYGEILIYGILNEDGSVTMLDYHNYNYNYFIYILSFIAALAIIAYFFREWKMTWGGIRDA